MNNVEAMGKLNSKHVCRREGPEGECFLVNTHVNTSGFTTSDLSTSTDLRSDISSSASSCCKQHVPLTVLLPPVHPPTMEKKSDITTDNNNPDDHHSTGISVEEFECGVSVAGSDRQEWSFTLYDFDGRGNITKDDLASLLKSLYDAVGSSIKLPSPGTKTLKLRLTVSPDNAKANGTTAQLIEQPDADKNENSGKLYGINNLKHVKNHDNSKLSSKESLKQNNLSAACDQLNVQVSVTSRDPSKQHHCRVQNNLSPGSPPGNVPVVMTTTERQQLAELVQQNMERHRRKTHALRRHNSDLQARRLSQHHHHHHYHHYQET